MSTSTTLASGSPRRLLAVVVATLLALITTPLTVAFAAPTGSASLTSPVSLFPTSSANFTFSVANGGAALVGESINWVRFVLPSDEAGIVHNGATITPPAGWTATRDGGADEVQTVTFRASQGAAAIRPGGSASFSFPAEVKRPLNSDEAGTFTVASSSDSGRTTSGLLPTGTGSLTTTVKILDIVDSAVGVVAPAGAADGNGTAGQDVDFGYSVINYAQQAVSVTGTLASTGGDTVSPASVTQSVPGAGTAAVGSETPVAFAHDVLLGAATSDRTSQFTVKAVVGAAAAAQDALKDYVVQARSAVTLTDLQPARTRSGDDSTVSFSALATKSGTPALDVTGGSLSFAGLSTPLKVAGDAADFGTGASSKRVTFDALTLNSAELKAIIDAEREYTPTVTAVATDGNGFGPALPGNLLTSKLLIDNLAPRVTVNVELPAGQSAVKNGDTLRVTGAIAAADVVPAGNLAVVLDPNRGPNVTVPVTTTKQADGTYTFAGSVQPQFVKGADRANSDTSFVALASVKDTAGNPGNGSTNTAAPFVIDNFLPELKTPGFTTSTTTIAVQFEDLDLGVTVGGCDPRQYRVNGVPGAVSEVRYNNGATCQVGQAAPTTSGQRILVLRSPMSDDATPTVTYEGVSAAFGGDPVRDGAANQTARTTIDTVRQIVPLAPEITEVTRNGGTETATSVVAGGKTTYYTRFPGSLAPADYAKNDLVVSFLGSKSGYSIQVLDGAGKPLATVPVAGPATPLDSGEQTVRIPIDAAQATYARSIRFITTNAAKETLLGAPTAFDVVLDTVAPRVTSTTRADKVVTVNFDDVLHSGTDFAGDWFGLVTVATGTRAYTAESASPGATANVRSLSIPFPADGTFKGVEYRFTSGPDGGQRYLDRAGNVVNNFKTA